MLQCPRGPLRDKKNCIFGIDTKVIAISGAIHLLLCITVLLIGSSSKKNIEFVVYGAHTKQPSQVLFKSMGTSKRVGDASVDKQKTRAASLQKNKKSNIKKSSSKKKSKKEFKKEKKVVPAKKAITTKGLKKGPHIKDLEAQEAEAAAKLEQKKKGKKKQKALLKKKEPEPEPEVKSKSEPESEEEIKEEKKIEKVEVEKVESELEFTVQNDAGQEGSGALPYNLMGSADQKMIAMQNEVQEAISQIWSPPVGVTKGTQARVLFKVDTTGIITEFEIERPSGIVIFDVSIMRIAAEIKFPRAVWGRRFPITFQQ